MKRLFFSFSTTFWELTTRKKDFLGVKTHLYDRIHERYFTVLFHFFYLKSLILRTPKSP